LPEGRIISGKLVFVVVGVVTSTPGCGDGNWISAVGTSSILVEGASVGDDGVDPLALELLSEGNSVGDCLAIVVGVI